MISLTADNNKVTLKGKGNSILVYIEELAVIGFLRDKLAEQLNISPETANEMIIEVLNEEE